MAQPVRPGWGATKFVGIDLGSHHVKVVVLAAGFRSAQVVDVIEEPVGEPPVREDGKRGDAFGHVLAVALGLLRTRGLLGQPTAIALPPSLLSYRLLNFPFADERKIAQLVPFESEGQFPVPMEQLVHGHVIVPARDGSGRALVVAAKRDKVEQITALFHRAGAEVKVVTSPALAAAQVSRVHLPTAVPGGERSTQPAALLVDFGHQFTHFTALGPRGPLAVRILRRGGRHLTQAIAARDGIDADSAALRKHETSLVGEGLTELEQGTRATILAAMEPVLRELEHTRLWLRATYHIDVQQLVLAGGGADAPGLAAYLGEQTHLPVHLAVPEASGLKVPPGRTWTTTLSALGAAYAAARRPLLQLHDDAAEGAGGTWLQERMSGIVALGIAVAAFGALDTIARVRAAEKELEAYKQQLGDATTPIFGEALSPRDLDAKLAEAEGQDLMRLIPDRGALEVLSMITSAATPSDLDPAKQAAAAAAAPSEDEAAPGAEGSGAQATDAGPGPIAPNAGIVMADDLTIASVQIRERKIEISASANISSAQDRLASKLAQLGCLSNITKGRVKGDERRSFEMTMESSCYRTKRASEEEAEG